MSPSSSSSPSSSLGPSFLSTALSGALASVMTKTLLYPADTFKCRFQARRFGNMADFASLWTVRGIYSGLFTKISLYGPYQALYMSSYSAFREALQSRSPLPPCLVFAASGILAELTAAVIRLPMEVAKQRAQTGTYKNFGHVVRAFRSRPLDFFSPRLFYAQTLLHDCPYGIIQWTIYEFLRPTGSGLASGMVAGAIAAALTNPLDVVKTRIVTSKVASQKSICGTVAIIRREEGLRAFGRGLVPRIIHIAPATGIYLGIFEFFRDSMAMMD